MKYLIICFCLFISSCVTTIDKKYRSIESNTELNNFSFKIDIVKYTVNELDYNPHWGNLHYKTTTGNTLKNKVSKLSLKKQFFKRNDANNPDITIRIGVARIHDWQANPYQVISLFSAFIIPFIEHDNIIMEVSFIDGCSEKLLKTYNIEQNTKTITQLLLLPFTPFRSFTSPVQMHANIILRTIKEALDENILISSCNSGIK